MSTTTAEVRPHAGAGKPRGHRKPNAWRTIAKMLGRDGRACWCLRCVLTRTGIYRRSRTQNDRRIEIETRILGVRVRRVVTPLTNG